LQTLKTIAHLNFAKGFRGGERQTIILIEELAKRGHQQVLFTRVESELANRCDKIKNLKIIKLRKPYIISFSKFKNLAILQAHETKAAQVAFLIHKIYSTPYIVTRRVGNSIKDNIINRAIYTNAYRVVALSKIIKKEIIAVAPAATIQIIADSQTNFHINADKAHYIKERYNGKFLIGNIGELNNDQKGQGFLIKAIKRFANEYPDIHCIFLGKGKDLEAYKKQAKSVNNITFEGFVDNVGDYISALDLFVFPSLTEGLGSILLDVMVQKVPIIASTAGGIPDILTHNETALLVPCKNSDAIYDSIVKLYENKKQCDFLTLNAFNQSHKYLPTVITDQYLTLYQKHLNL